MRWSPATIPAPASAGTATGRSSARSSASRWRGTATLRFRQRTGAGFRRANLELAPRSAYLLSGEAREQWEHGIAAHDGLRYSITFRTLSERGKAAANAPPA